MERHSKKPSSASHAIHLQNGEDHLCVLGNIDVLISEANDGWFAQGVQIDYFACGESLEDVQARFTKGLIASMEEHLRRYQTIEKFMKWAPDEVRAEIQNKFDSEQYTYTVLNSCHIPQPHIPLNIQYYKVEPKQQAA